MHRKEIEKLAGEVQAKGMTLIPLEIYFKKGMAKVSVGLAKGKNTEDRREEIKKRDTEREIRRAYSR
jgi:SsrA-binding protein